MASGSLDETAYGRLLARTQPRVIKSEEENDRIVAELEQLDTRGRPLTPEEEQLAELMTLLVRQYENLSIRWGTPSLWRHSAFSSKTAE